MILLARIIFTKIVRLAIHPSLLANSRALSCDPLISDLLCVLCGRLQGVPGATIVAHKETFSCFLVLQRVCHFDYQKEPHLTAGYWYSLDRSNLSRCAVCPATVVLHLYEAHAEGWLSKTGRIDKECSIIVSAFLFRSQGRRLCEAEQGDSHDYKRPQKNVRLQQLLDLESATCLMLFRLG